jgi:uncharacterized protein YraI
MRKICFSFVLILVLLTGCSLPGKAEPTATATQAPSPTNTKPPTVTATASLTPFPSPTEEPTIMPTIVPFKGIALAPTNVRSGPGKGGNKRLGGIFGNQAVNVIGRNDAANWLYILFSDSPTGTGWVLKKAINISDDNFTHLPIIIYPNGPDRPLMLPPLVYQVSGAPLPLNQPPAGAKTAVVQQMINVRLGPSVGFMQIGVLQPGAVVTLTGRIQDNYWAQIEYPSGLEGRAWISTELIKPADGYGGLPFFNLLGTPVAAEKASAPEQDLTETPDPNVTVAPTETLLPPTATQALGLIGYVKAQINVRGGPAQTFDSLGLLNPGDSVQITGRNLIGNWLQIEYPAGALTRGWVATDYIDYTGIDLSKLPYFDNDGKPLPAP